VQREPVVTARRCRARCARSAEQRDRRRSVLPWSGVAGGGGEVRRSCRGTDGKMEGEIAVERDGNRRTGASHPIK